MSTDIRASIHRDCRSVKKTFGLERKKFESLSSAYIANRKFIRFALASVSPEEFQEIINRKLIQTPGDPISMTDLMYHAIENKLIHLDNDSSITLWKLALSHGIVPAIKKLYLYIL